MTESISVREAWGGVVVERDHGSGFRERYWFQTTDAGRLVLCAHIREYDEDTHGFPVEGRHYTPRSNLDVDDEVRDALAEHGYSGDLYVQRGRRAEGVEPL